MNIWFTSDTHYGHRNIIEYCNRPFRDVEEMDQTMIDRWNGVVHEGDIVYHLGDFSFYRDRGHVERIIYSLKGTKNLIYGNHDRGVVRQAGGFAWKGDYKRIVVGQQRIVLFHYAMKHWHGSHKGSWQLHGHSHGSMPRDHKMKQLDVGVDPWGFTPLSLEQIREEMKKHTFVPVDHHGE